MRLATTIIFGILWNCVLRGQICLANPDSKRLYDDLLSNYNRLIRPVVNHTETVTVKLGLRLSQLVDLNLKDQILTTNVWIEHEWHDYKFTWEPTEYGGVREIYVPSEHIWLPDIILYNNADGDYIVKTMTKAILHHDGKVLWNPPAIFKSSCEIDVEFFPFDTQVCHLKFGSWSFDGFQVDLIHIDAVPGNNTVEYGMDLSEYYLNVEWDILSVPAERHIKYYPCCPEPYPDIYFNMVIRRKPLFYIVNLIIPCVGIFYLSILVFYLPAQSKQKTGLVITLLVSQTFYLTLIIEVIPATSLTLPLLGRYLLFSMVWIAIAIILTAWIINIHYRQPSTHKMQPWVRRVFIQKLPRILMMRVPMQVIKNSMSTRRSKFLRQSDPALKTLTGDDQDEGPQTTSNGEQKENGNKNGDPNGSKSSDFKGHLNGLYNGLANIMTTTCDLGPDSRSQVAPFAVEKAVHNIMFIKHHMKRQDEFDAEDQDWGIVAMVLDRLFLYMFGASALFGSYMILSNSPEEDPEHTEPIDIIHSKIAAEDRMSSSLLD